MKRRDSLKFLGALALGARVLGARAARLGIRITVPGTRPIAAALGMPLLAPLVTPAVAATSWPNRPLRILLGFPGGSTPDMVARALADPLARRLGQAVVVEAHPGAGGNIATDQVAKAVDDHTLGVVINGNLTTARQLYPRLPYDPQTDFTLLSLLATAPLVLAARSDIPDGRAFLAAAAQSGERWSYGSVGTGSMAHLGMELLKSRTPGMNSLHVPYQGNPAVINAILGGQIQLALVPPGLVIPQVKAGRLKAIGLTGPASALAPGVPPLAEIGVKDFQLSVWAALVGPARLSAEAQSRLGALIGPILNEPETRERLFNQGWEAQGSSAATLRERVQEETAQMSILMNEKGIHLE